MSRFLKSFLCSACIAACFVVATPTTQQADAARRRYWNNYWNWYNSSYRPYYRYRYNYGPGYYNYSYRYGNPGYNYGYGSPYTSYYYGVQPGIGVQLGPFGVQRWY